MRQLLLWLCSAACVLGGSVQGVVLDWASGKPLSRTPVILTPLPGSSSGTRSMQLRSGPLGAFSFLKVPPGLYILEAQREGYLPAAHGQRRPEGHGRPVFVDDDSNLFSELRMHRMGALMGYVLDENGIGIPRVNVLAYAASLPLRSAGTGVSDDRGQFRISGLTLGSYWVRSAGHQLDDGTPLLPMFGPDAPEPRDAIRYQVRYDDDTPDANVRPVMGRLSLLSGHIACDRGPGSPVVLVLSSEVMRRQITGGCDGGFEFGGLPPANYEVFAYYPDGGGFGFIEQNVSHNVKTVVQLAKGPELAFEIRDADTRAPIQTKIRIAGRRNDLSGPGQAQEITYPRSGLPPGYWELAATVGPEQYIERIEGRPWRREGFYSLPTEGFPIYVDPRFAGQPVRILLSRRAGAIGGVVRQEGKPVPGAPVYAWPVDEINRRRLAGGKEQLAGVDGSYQFTGLPPGEYRVFATFDTRQISAEIAEETQSISIRLSPGQSTIADLSVWRSP
ncbi:MAG TPA: hypothetical protein VFQ91_19625 [Bryobacteraceae bacterium]|nr:hypothetical protein [Bryobacteraceae bacterium]